MRREDGPSYGEISAERDGLYFTASLEGRPRLEELERELKGMRSQRAAREADQRNELTIAAAERMGKESAA